MGQEVVEECGGAAWVKRVVLRVESSEFWVRVYAMWGKSQEVCRSNEWRHGSRVSGSVLLHTLIRMMLRLKIPPSAMNASTSSRKPRVARPPNWLALISTTMPSAMHFISFTSAWMMWIHSQGQHRTPQTLGHSTQYSRVSAV